MTRDRFALAATDAFRWVAAQAVEVPGGWAWTEDGSPCDDLYSGTAGVLLACAEATRAGVVCAEAAGRSLDRLVRLAEQRNVPSEGGLYGGAAGMLVALRAWAEVSADRGAVSAADLVLEQVCEQVLADSDGRPYDVISGDAGLLMALQAEWSPAALQARAALVDRLVAAAERSELGLPWRMSPEDTDRLRPGFSHGTAGVATALAMAAGPLGRPELAGLAAQAGHSLIAMATTPQGWVLPHRLPPTSQPPAVSFGWCHGPAGTLRLFCALSDVAPDPAWPVAIEACLQALRDSGLPERRYPGFWDNVARCCGTAGVGSMLLDRYEVTGDPELLRWSAELADDVLSYAITDGQGTRWSNVEHTANPADLPPEAGLMQGAAGIAGWLARLSAALA
jgi:lantibiotic modifying enzyme